MLKVEVVAVGRELLIGKTVNTNAHWIGGRLAREGGRLSRITTIDDNLEEIADTLSESLGRSPDFLILVGGLGPTPDDMTLEGLAKALRRRIRLSRGALEMVRNHYAEMGRADLRLTPSRKKMARLPEGATPLPNKVGTAPGVRLVSGGTVIFCLPGVPREMKRIFNESLLEEIKERLGKLYSRTVIMNLEGIFESTLAPILKATAKKYPGVYIKSHPKGVEEGVSKIELNVGVVSETKGDSVRVSRQVATELQRRVTDAGAAVKWDEGRSD